MATLFELNTGRFAVLVTKSSLGREKATREELLVLSFDSKELAKIAAGNIDENNRLTAIELFESQPTSSNAGSADFLEITKLGLLGHV